jgi:hypothetical protein
MIVSLEMKDKIELLKKLRSSSFNQGQAGYTLKKFRDEIEERWKAKTHMEALLYLITRVEDKHELPNLKSLIVEHTIVVQTARKVKERKEYEVPLDNFLVGAFEVRLTN